MICLVYPRWITGYQSAVEGSQPTPPVATLPDMQSLMIVGDVILSVAREHPIQFSSELMQGKFAS